MVARAVVESRINKTNTNNQVHVTWEKDEKQTMNSITKLTLAAAALRRTMQTNTVVEGVSFKRRTQALVRAHV
jgi:hypothetical protein